MTREDFSVVSFSLGFISALLVILVVGMLFFRSGGFRPNGGMQFGSQQTSDSSGRQLRNSNFQDNGQQGLGNPPAVDDNALPDRLGTTDNGGTDAGTPPSQPGQK